MIHRKKEIKRIFVASLFIIAIFFSSLNFPNNYNTYQNDKFESTSEENQFKEINLSSNLNLSDPITGSGLNQSVRIYVNNKSQNYNDNQEFFEIPSLTSEEMILTYGNFSFEFQNNYTTDYVIEDDDALYADNPIAFDFNASYSNIFYHNGTPTSGGFSLLTDGDPNGSPLVITSDNGVINFTITANYTDAKFEIDENRIVQFNRTKILALVSNLFFDLTADADVYLTVRIKNISQPQPTWVDIITSLSINSSIKNQELTENIINENLNFINLTNVCNIQFIFVNQSPGEFSANLYEYDLQSTYAFDLPITNETYVALEFDLKGKESTVNGVNLWIRTLNVSEASKTHFNLTLYRANTTISRDESSLRKNNLRPDYDEELGNKRVDSYIGDNYSYFEFNLPIDELNLSNYFIVIKSNNSQNVYSLVTLPCFGYGADGETEHQLKITNDNGNNWINAKKTIKTHNLDYLTGQLDASLFTINVTRGYMPSDFNMSGRYNLTIQDLPIEDLEISFYPEKECSNLTWGIGQWIHNFTYPISDENSNNFTVYLSWNKTNIKGFHFNVSSYSVNGYWIEKALTTYNVSYNDDPEWIFKYTRDNTSQYFTNWTFYELWYIYEDYFSAQNLTNPDGQEILWQLNEQSYLDTNSHKYKLVVPKNFSANGGNYLLNLTSHNFIHKMHSYINYNGTLWETNGFMYGDNISIGVEIQDHKYKAPVNGNINAMLFYPNGTRFIGATLNSSNGYIEESTLIYDFADRTILNFTNSLTVFGHYHLAFFWFNGTAIGCKEIILYLDAYEVDLYNLDYNSNINKNIIDGKIEKVYQNFTLLLASVNETTGTYDPTYYPINDSDIDTQLVYEIGDQEIPILIDEFKQNQNILNPDETVNVKVSIRNLYNILPIDVKVNVKLVSYANEDWIIAENTSKSVVLNFSGTSNDSFEYDINLKIPNLNKSTNVWAGENNPIRLTGAKTLITVFVDDNEIGTHETGNYSLISSETSDTYDGYILALKINEGMNTENLLNDFKRDECLYLPYETSFLVNIFDKNYLSSYEQCSEEFSLMLNSKFINTTINPETPIKGQTFNISSILTTEFEDGLANKNVSLQYYDSNSWLNLSSATSNSLGQVSFIINTQLLDIEGNLLVKLLWAGDLVNGASKNISISIIYQSNQISINIEKQSPIIYQNRQEIIRITIRNIGNSNLRILNNFSFDFNCTLSYSIASIDYLQLERISPGESTVLVLEIDIGNINNLSIVTSITTQNILTNESITTTSKTSFKVYSAPLFDSFIDYFIIIIGIIFAIIWASAILYAWKTKKRIETPVEEPVKRRTRRQRYVPVSELKKPTIPKKPLKKKEESKEIQEKEKTDLDSLLEERGLADKKKKTE
ncbi:MAG: hypothetical protein ACFFDH_15565 [Promethearchaeota archaeon]